MNASPQLQELLKNIEAGFTVDQEVLARLVREHMEAFQPVAWRVKTGRGDWVIATDLRVLRYLEGKEEPLYGQVRPL